MKLGKIVQIVAIGAKPVEVYAALVDPRKHSEFTGSKAVGTDKLGKFSTWGGYSFGKNIKLANGKRIEQEWQTADWPDGAKPSKTVFVFEAKGAGTLLKFTQTDVPLEQLENYKQGWIDYYWEPLKKYFNK